MKVAKTLLLSSCAAPLLVAAVATAADTDWPHFGNDAGNSKYSPLAQIDADNFDRLEVVWAWESVDTEIPNLPDSIRPRSFKAIPVVIDGRMYVSTPLGQVAAIDAASGKPLWSYDPQSWEAGRPANMGFQHRGVALWRKGEKQRVIMATHDRRLLSLDATTGRPDPAFGKRGALEMTPDLGREVLESRTTHSSPPAICRDTVIVGSIVGDIATHQEAPPGFVRAYDAETGALAWVFYTIPQQGEEGSETWENESWRYSGNTNVWSMITVDEELGRAYLPIGTPTSDLYGGHRLGDNLYAESLVAVDCETGEKRWHFQIVHHGLWDYDLPPPPNRIDLMVDGELRKVVAQASKQAFLFILDATTGEPLWPVEERPVPPSQVPGERASPTQPFPTRPAAYDRQGISTEDLIDFTPQLRKEALEIASAYELAPLYTPPRVTGQGKPVIQIPGPGGGTNWTGTAVDPESGMIYVPSYATPRSVSLTPPDPNRSDLRYVPDGWYEYLEGPRGLPLVKPPYGRVTAIDLATGEHVWVAAHGEGPRNHPTIKHLGLDRLGSPDRSAAPLVTKTLLFVTHRAESLLFVTQRAVSTTRADSPIRDRPPEISVYDKKTGAYLGGIELPATPNSNLITYEVDGRQYLAVSVGGGREAAETDSTPAGVVALAADLHFKEGVE